MNGYNDAKERGERVADSIIALVRRHVLENAATKDETACLSSICEALGAECSDLRYGSAVLSAAVDGLEREIRRRRRPEPLPLVLHCRCNGDHIFDGRWVYHGGWAVWEDIVSGRWARRVPGGGFEYVQLDGETGEWTWMET